MGKSLVAFFSASSAKVTRGVAKKLAYAIKADLFAIEPEVEYTLEDLDWQNKQSRSSVEMEDRSSRPAISSKVDDMSQYDTVFLGFPIWWYREPSIIDTFIEQYDFSGKTIILFCTSGSSQIGEAVENIQNLAPNAKVTGGARFSSDTTEDELAEYVKLF